MFLLQIQEFCVFKRTVLGSIRRGRHFCSWVDVLWQCHWSCREQRDGDPRYRVGCQPYRWLFRVFRKLIRSVVEDVILILYIGNLFSQESGKHITNSSDIFTLRYLHWSLKYISTYPQPAEHRTARRFFEELKGIEYGCTVDAVSLLIPAMQRQRANQKTAATVPGIWRREVVVVFQGKLSEVVGFSVRKLWSKKFKPFTPLVN